MQQRLIQIESLRCLATLFVAYSHWLEPVGINKLVPIGIWGIDIFFVISGFFIVQVLLNDKTKEEAKGKMLWQYYLRRVLRLFPLYYLTLLLLFLFNQAVLSDDLPSLISYTFNFELIRQADWSGTTSHLWSLSADIHFYLLLPICILFLPDKWLPTLFSVFILASLLYKIALFQAEAGYMNFHVHTLSCLDNLSMGALLAYALIKKPDYTKKLLRSIWMPIAAIAILLVIIIPAYVYGQYNFFNVALVHNSISLLSIWMVGRAAMGETIFGKWLGEHPAMLFMGKISYGFYLWHNFVPGMLIGIGLSQNPWIRSFLYLPVTIFIAYILWWLIEKRGMELKKFFSSAPK